MRDLLIGLALVALLASEAGTRERVDDLRSFAAAALRLAERGADGCAARRPKRPEVWAKDSDAGAVLQALPRRGGPGIGSSRQSKARPAS